MGGSWFEGRWELLVHLSRRCQTDILGGWEWNMSKPLPIPRGSVTSTPPQTMEGGSEARLALVWWEVEGS